MVAKTLFLILMLLAPAAALGAAPAGGAGVPLTGTDFVYDCVIRLKRAGQPLTGADITVGADMPSMPMAHNVKPVKAKPGKAPGEYLAPAWTWRCRANGR